MSETKIVLPRTPVGGKLSVVKPELLWDASSSIADLLQKLPEITIRAQGGDGQRQIASLRGASEEQVLILIDGVRLNSSGGGGVDLSSIPAVAVERIEIITGGAAALYGPEALGGVVSIITRKVEKPLLASTLSLGSFDTLSASITYGATKGPWRLLSVLSGVTGQGDFAFIDRNGFERIRINNASRIGAVLLKGNRQIGGPWSLELLAKFNATGRGVPGPEQFESDSSLQLNRNALLSATIKGNSVVEGLDYSLQTFLQTTQFRFHDPSPTLGPPLDSRSREIRPGVLGSMHIQHKNHRFTSQISLWREAFFSQEILQQRIGRTRGSVAIFDEMSWGRFLLSPALRFEGSSDAGLAVLPRLGLSFAVKNGLSLQAALGRSYRFPSFRDRFVQLDGISGNADLLPEDAWELSTGLSLKRPGFWLKTTVFTRWIENLILFSPVSAFFIRADNFSGFLANGAELSLSANLGSLFLEGNYSLFTTSTRERTDPSLDLQIPGFPSRRFFGRASWKKNTFQVFFQGDIQDTFFLNRFNTQEAPARIFFDSGVAVFFEKIWLSFAIKNLLDTRTAVDFLQAPLPPRSFTLTFSKNFHNDQGVFTR